jgi:hypothetical protein
MVQAAGIAINSRPLDESPGVCVIDRVQVCSASMNRPLWTRMMGGVGGVGEIPTSTRLDKPRQSLLCTITVL